MPPPLDPPPPEFPLRIAHLVRIAAAPARTILGLMSGTSLDGLDLALCRIAGHGASTRVELLHFATRPYSVEDKARLREVAFREQVSLRALTQLNGWIAEWHAQAILSQLAEWNVRATEVDAIASHGQTVFHAPQPQPFPPFGKLRAGSSGEGSQLHAPPPSPHGGEGVARRGRDGGEDGSSPPLHAVERGMGGEAFGHSTLQLGDGDRIAYRTGILTVSDFRQKEIAAGGEGAPLAPYAEALCFAAPGRSRILLNIGGIANFTWLPRQDAATRWISGDTGPGNTLIDAAVRAEFPERKEGYDPNGVFAAEGRVHVEALARLKAHDYFSRPFPKSTGPEEFGAGYAAQALAEFGPRALNRHDRIATLTRLTAETIADAIRATVTPLAGSELYVSGGGARNRTLMRWLAESLPEVAVADSAALGIPPDAKEAVLFAVLANETLAGAGFPARDGSARRVVLGKLSFAE